MARLVHELAEKMKKLGDFVKKMARLHQIRAGQARGWPVSRQKFTERHKYKLRIFVKNHQIQKLARICWIKGFPGCGVAPAELVL